MDKQNLAPTPTPTPGSVQEVCLTLSPASAKRDYRQSDMMSGLIYLNLLVQIQGLNPNHLWTAGDNVTSGTERLSVLVKQTNDIGNTHVMNQPPYGSTIYTVYMNIVLLLLLVVGWKL